MKILHIGAHDACGSGYWLSRAINRRTRHFAVNVRFVDDWSRTPAYIWASKYSRQTVRNMIHKADVVHFSIHVKPFFSAFNLNKKIMQEKKIFVYYHGTVLRTNAEEVRAEAKEYVPDHVVTVSTPDLLAFIEADQEAYWLPVIRDFKYIQEKYGFSDKEVKAAKLFGKKKLVTIGHATSSVQKKGSKFFFMCLTDMMRFNRTIRSSIIINTPWDSCMRKMSEFDVALGNAAPISSYGLTCVEAGVFKIPAATFMNEDGRKMYEAIVGSAPPLISWVSLKDLFHKLQKLSEDAKMRRDLGKKLHDWMRPLHDEAPVVERYMRMVLHKK